MHAMIGIVRPATPQDAAACVAIYRPYVALNVRVERPVDKSLEPPQRRHGRRRYSGCGTGGRGWRVVGAIRRGQTDGGRADRRG